MISPLLSFLAALLLIVLYRPLAQRWRQLDEPNARSAHGRPVLSSAGIAVLAALLCGLSIGHGGESPGLALREQTALVLAALLCAIGALDDRWSLPVRLRLLCFLVLGAVAVILYLPLTGPRSWILATVGAIAFVWIVNLFNFMDGIDGIAALQCVTVAAALGALGILAGAEASYVRVALSVAAAYAAFLCFNWPPAALFMGDAGSLPGGFLLAWLGAWGWSIGAVAPQFWLLLMSPFLIDTGLTLLRRLIRGAVITEAHSEHIYQRLARRWQSHRRVDLALLALHALWLLPLLLLSAGGRLDPNLALLLAVLPQLCTAAGFVARDDRLQ